MSKNADHPFAPLAGRAGDPSPGGRGVTPKGSLGLRRRLLLALAPDSRLPARLGHHLLEAAPDSTGLPEPEEVEQLPFGEVPDHFGGPVLGEELPNRFRQLQEPEGAPDAEGRLPECALEGGGALEPPDLHLTGIEEGPLEGGRPLQVSLVLGPDSLVDLVQVLEGIRSVF